MPKQYAREGISSALGITSSASDYSLLTFCQEKQNKKACHGD
jgi:hypothetical protein